MALTVLQVSYPLAPVGIDTAGGAEQILAWLDRGLTARGDRSLVVAPEGSRVAGTLLPVPRTDGALDAAAMAAARDRHRTAILRALERHPVDLVHLHGIDALDYLPPPGVPALITLHLPPDWYPPAIWRLDRPDTWLVPVSGAQARDCPPAPGLLPPVPNGIPIAELDRRHRKAGFAAALGRVCPEKGLHLAAEAARAADRDLLIAGRLYPYPDHVRYADTVLRPALDRRRRWIGPVGFRAKRRLLGMARCVLVPSLCAETGSLVAMEALACGTPVIAFPNGALADVVEEGVTGHLVPDVAAMADAIGRADRIDPEACRAAARARFGLDAMVEGYRAVYRRILSGTPARAAAR